MCYDFVVFIQDRHILCICVCVSVCLCLYVRNSAVKKKALMKGNENSVDDLLLNVCVLACSCGLTG